MDEVEGLPAVDAAEEALRVGGEVEGVARSGGGGDGDAGEGAVGGVVQVAAEDAAHVGARDDLGEGRLVVQLEHGHDFEGGRHGRVVDGEEGAVRCRFGEDAAQPVELLGGDLAVVVAGNGGVERDDAQSAHVVDAVLGLVGGFFVEEETRVGGALVVVAHDPDELRVESLGDGFDGGAQAEVGVWFAEVGEVAGEDERVGVDGARLEAAECVGEALLDGHGAVELAAVGEEVRVGDVHDDVPCWRVLPQLRHGGMVAAPGDRVSGTRAHPASSGGGRGAAVELERAEGGANAALLLSDGAGELDDALGSSGSERVEDSRVSGGFPRGAGRLRVAEIEDGVSAEGEFHDLGHGGHALRAAGAQQTVAPGTRGARDRTGDDADFPAEGVGVTGRVERAGSVARFDDDRRARERRDEPVALKVSKLYA